MTRVAIVSPHLDDAVLSAWLVLDHAPRARVISCFAGTPPSNVSGTWDTATKFASSEQAVAARRQEDVTALALTDSQAVHLDLLDEQYRDGQDPPARELIELLRMHLADAEEVWLPAGLGNHTDHLAARDAALAATAMTNQRVLVYADLPYAGQPAWPTDVTHTVRDRMCNRLAGALKRPTPEARWRSTLATAGLSQRLGRRAIDQLTRADLQAKVTAVRCYTSQLDALRCGQRHAWRERRIFAFEVYWPLQR